MLRPYRFLSVLAIFASCLAGAAALVLAQGAAASASDLDLSRQALTNDPETPTGGNPSGDLTIVAFFDYNCPYCIKTEPALERLVAADHGIRLVYKDWPIFGAGSVAAARVALASKWQGKYMAVHDALLGNHLRKASQDQVRDLAIKAGDDPVRLDADLRDHAGEIDRILARTEKQADKMEFAGTPVFLIGPLLVAAALDDEGLKDAVRQARARQR